MPDSNTIAMKRCQTMEKAKGGRKGQDDQQGTERFVAAALGRERNEERRETARKKKMGGWKRDLEGTKKVVNKSSP